jgi:hypothetical protein
LNHKRFPQFNIFSDRLSEVGFKQVYQLLERVSWNLFECRDSIYDPYGNKVGQQKRTLPVWLYGELNRARNDFLHGNKITDHRLIVAPGKRALNLYTAPLFKLALTGYLDLRMDRPPARESEPTMKLSLRISTSSAGTSAIWRRR